ncbi:replication protein A [Rhizobium sp. LC145]|uniref:replication protein A n=1 Tax=Rhizobium sp. LC145 TaxID=1120688 RepID=UPI00062A2844|nr:replication protein A [Rhizobium sp. LC145]KKX24293.1 replication protein A [Rhizobium sp. LC145]TKT46162.1 helix-turn-helix domain-containing protein [Rhizobiaceae bacterium LC148]
MFKQMGAALAIVPAKGRRARTPVHRNSRLAGHCEGVFWRRTTRQDARRIVLAARKYEIANKQHGCRNGPLGAVGIEILEYLANLIDFRTGRLEPSLDTMMAKLRRSRDAIVRGLKALRQHGFIDWLRRYVPTENEGKGPQVKQTSNAYRLALPPRAAACLGRYGEAPPLPEDREQADMERVAVIEEHRKGLALDQLALFDVGDNRLGQALARLGSFIKQRESARQTESPSRFLSKREE